MHLYVKLGVPDALNDSNSQLIYIKYLATDIFL
jgi:hypothetical protein